MDTTPEDGKGGVPENVSINVRIKKRTRSNIHFKEHQCHWVVKKPRIKKRIYVKESACAAWEP